MYVLFWISSSFLASCLSSSCFTVSSRLGQWGKPRAAQGLSESCPQPMRICCTEGKGSACSPVSGLLQAPRAPRGCYGAISLQLCIPGSVITLLKKSVSKSSVKEQEIMGGISPKEKLQLAAGWSSFVQHRIIFTQAGWFNFSLVSLYLLWSSNLQSLWKRFSILMKIQG